MTQLRQRMIECLQLRGLSERTQESYVQAVRLLAEHYHKSVLKPVSLVGHAPILDPPSLFLQPRAGVPVGIFYREDENKTVMAFPGAKTRNLSDAFLRAFAPGSPTSRQRLIARWWSKARKPGMPCARPVS